MVISNSEGLELAVVVGAPRAGAPSIGQILPLHHASQIGAVAVSSGVRDLTGTGVLRRVRILSETVGQEATSPRKLG
jgi:hypothetical protein